VAIASLAETIVRAVNQRGTNATVETMLGLGMVASVMLVPPDELAKILGSLAKVGLSIAPLIFGWRFRATMQKRS